MKEAFHYKDIYLVPRLSNLTSRSEAKISLEWGNFNFSTPTIPANMQSVINEDLAFWCAENNIPYFYHRFGNTLEFVKKANQQGLFTSISLGVKGGDRELLSQIKKEGLKVDMAVIDVAHGFSELVKIMIEEVKQYGIFTVAGNIWGNRESIETLESWGADALKVGLSCGSGCTTYNQTSFGSPMFTAALEAGKWATIPLIIDGGIKTNGDITKAIRAVLEFGNKAPLVMAGSLLAACIDAPGENIYETFVSTDPNSPLPKITHKKYHGSASAKQKGERKHVEGKEVTLECNQMTYAEKYQEIKESLQSSISYAGGKSLIDIKEVEVVYTR